MAGLFSITFGCEKASLLDSHVADRGWSSDSTKCLLLSLCQIVLHIIILRNSYIIKICHPVRMSLVNGERHIRKYKETRDEMILFDICPYIGSQEVPSDLFNTNVAPTKPPCFTLYFMQIYWTNEPLLGKC